MAAGRSRVESIHRGAKTGRGAKVLREGLAPLPSFPLYVPAIDSLEEICGWLGTFRERLRVARVDERPHFAAVVEQLEARYMTRRAQLPWGRDLAHAKVSPGPPPPPPPRRPRRRIRLVIWA